MKNSTTTYVKGHENNGGGDKKATTRQIRKIERLANKLGSYGNSITQKLYNRNLVELRGREAHELIQLLMSEVAKKEVAEQSKKSSKNPEKAPPRR